MTIQFKIRKTCFRWRSGDMFWRGNVTGWNAVKAWLGIEILRIVE